MTKRSGIFAAMAALGLVLLSIGLPDFDVADPVKAAATEAARRGGP